MNNIKLKQIILDSITYATDSDRELNANFPR